MVLPMLRTLKYEGTLTSYHSFREYGSTLSFPHLSASGALR
jgi:hypothetical protein